MSVESSLLLTTPEPTASSLPPPGSLIEWGVLVGLVGWLGRKAWEYFSCKEESESTLIKTLINDLRESQTRLISDSREAQLQLLQQIQLKESLNQAASAIHEEIKAIRVENQRFMQGQASLYAESRKQLAALEKKVDAIHSRMDERST
ncbi:MAG: hypothetical protein F6K19_48450 [Cyanothece sp. SIO1E1]|nr:hypothetical protein [Cyanothece sp. SIO1E1]